jgi:hypothetical protein
MTVGVEALPSGISETEIVKLLVVFDPVESETVTVTDEFPAAVGVPEITPVAVLIDSPLGRLPVAA